MLSTYRRCTTLLALLCALIALPAHAAFIALDPTGTGQIEQNILPSVPPSVFPTYAHYQPLERVDLASILGTGPPDPISAVANHTVGYLLFDLGALSFSPLYASLQVDVNAQGPALDNLQVTSIDTITPTALAALPTGAMTAPEGNALRLDIGLDGDLLGSHGLASGNQGFNIDLNALGLLEITGAGNGLLALGLAYQWDGNPPVNNARVLFNGAPRLLLSDAPIVVPVPGGFLLLLTGLGALAWQRRTSRITR